MGRCSPRQDYVSRIPKVRHLALRGILLAVSRRLCIAGHGGSNPPPFSKPSVGAQEESAWIVTAEIVLRFPGLRLWLSQISERDNLRGQRKVKERSGP
jgi:hypothetical protein